MAAKAQSFREFAKQVGKNYHPHTCRYCGRKFFHTQEGDCWKTKHLPCPNAECVAKEDVWKAQGDLEF